MRIDLLLNKLCLVKTRSIAKKACDNNLVSINGKPAKASATVAAGDIVSFELSGYRNTLRVTKVPTGNVSKKTAPEYYEIISHAKLEIPEG